MPQPTDNLRVTIIAHRGDFDASMKSLWQASGATEVEVHAPEALEDLLSAGTAPDLLVVRADDQEVAEVIDGVREISPSTLVAVWAPKPTVEGAVQAIRRGAIDYLSSTLAPEGIENLMRRARARRIPAEPRPNGSVTDDDWQSLLGESAAMKRLLREVQAVARHDATVLLQGETGSGKERVARLIHRLSARALKPFVICNCSAVVPTLAESELFGHEKGAFTGARRAKAGFFEAARGGTLFFDQVQELPLTLQPKLLRVLENREFTRLGATRGMKADVRVIGAANRDLREEVKEKRFREDLFYRLNTATLAIPPLRERREDIPLLVEHFLAHFSNQFRKPTRLISRDAMNRLMQHPWEGNVRELRNVIERAVAVSRRRVVTRRELFLTPAEKAPAPKPELEPAELISLDELERNQIRRVLGMTGGNRERAAKALGLSRSTLYRRLSELGL
ncbi:MAG: sigma-54 interaction domain-containing protein [Candidatus Binatia bacterium]